jgi:hypothetical protein
VIKSLTILPKIVIPKIIPVIIARRTANNRVNLKTSKKRGNRTIHKIIVRQPVAKSFDSNIWYPFEIASHELWRVWPIADYNRCGWMKEGRIRCLIYSNDTPLGLQEVNRKPL